MRHSISFWILFLWAMFFTHCTSLEYGTPSPEEFNDYDLLYSYSGINMRFEKLNIIYLFKQIALGAEFGGSSRVIRKWKTPMRLFATGEMTAELQRELTLVISEINDLTGETFFIEQVSDSLSANFYVYAGEKIAFARRFPSLANYLDENLGLVSIHYNEQHEIHQGEVFIDVYRTTPRKQLHILREEITQGLGLLNDLKYNRESIFYAEESHVNQYAPQDREVIRLLYHPLMPTGIGEDAVDQVGKQIFGI